MVGGAACPRSRTSCEVSQSFVTTTPTGGSAHESTQGTREPPQGTHSRPDRRPAGRPRCRPGRHSPGPARLHPGTRRGAFPGGGGRGLGSGGLGDTGAGQQGGGQGGYECLAGAHECLAWTHVRILLWGWSSRNFAKLRTTFGISDKRRRRPCKSLVRHGSWRAVDRKYPGGKGGVKSSGRGQWNQKSSVSGFVPSCRALSHSWASNRMASTNRRAAPRNSGSRRSRTRV